MSKQVNTTALATYAKYARPAYECAHLPLLQHADVPDTTLMQTLYKALTLRRAGDSLEEAAFVAWLCNRLPVTMIDSAGNIHVDLRKGPMHRTMFTSHTDTVHYYGGRNEVRLDVQADKTLWRAGENHALGADDGAGIALMMHMMEAGVAGYYIFFRGEESGGIGSSWLADEMPEALIDIDRCISLDRADYSNVITHQAGGRCCSDEFANALSDQLTTDDLSVAYMPDSTGVFTDSANLTQHIAECTNLSVGYKHQHGDHEWQDVTFLQKLAAQLPLVAWDDLPVRRDPKAKEPRYGRYYDFKPETTTTTTSATPKLDDLNYADWWDKNWDKDDVEVTARLLDTGDEFENYVVDALYSAADEDYAAIRGIVSEHMLPDDPEQARRHLDPRRVTEHEYQTYAGDIECGRLDVWTALDELVVNLYKE